MANIYDGVIKELEIIRGDGTFFRTGLLTDANLEIKAEPIKRRLSGQEATLGYNVSFKAELAELDGLDDISAFNNQICTVLFDTMLGSERVLDTLNIEDGAFVPLFDSVRINVEPAVDFTKPAGAVILITGAKQVRELINNVFIYDAEKLEEIKNRYIGTIMDFNAFGDLDMNTVDENYDFNNN